MALPPNVPKNVWRSLAAALGLLPLTAQTPVPESLPVPPAPPEPVAIQAPAAPNPPPAPPPANAPTTLHLQRTSPHTSPDDMRRAYQELSAKRQKDYDKTQDASASQLLTLLEVARRTGASLGDLIATGDLESARTWNDYVRPPIKGENGQPALGAAQGVWQFMPGTFASVVRLYGTQILRQSDANPAKGLPALDLGNETHTDAEVREILRRNADNPQAGGEDLQALRSNFAVATLAKYFLDAEAGPDASPEKRYLIHFMGAPEAAQVLALAADPTHSNTLAVKRPPEPAPITPKPLPQKQEKVIGKGKTVPAPAPPPLTQPEEAPTTPVVPLAPPPTPDTWGLDPESATVRNNKWLFFNGTEPRTWGQFMDNLKAKAAADNNPALVRQKYGVGFDLKRGDTPGWSAQGQNPQQLAASVTPFATDSGTPAPLPKGLVYGPLNKDEQARYVSRLAGMVQQGQDQPRADLSPEETVWLTGALKRQGVLPPATPPQTPVTDPAVVAAMQKFRKRVGMGEPDNPAHAAMLTPMLQAALETYDARLQPYLVQQEKQGPAHASALNLATLGKADPATRQAAAPQILALKEGMKNAGILQPKTKIVTETKTNSRGKPYKARQTVPLPFDETVDKGLIARLDEFQLRQGLRPTHGVLDTATLEALGVTLPVPATAPTPATVPVVQADAPAPTRAFNPTAGSPTTPPPTAPAQATPQPHAPRPGLP